MDPTKRTYHYDIKNHTWTKVKEGTKGMPNGHDAFTLFYYDPNSGHFLLYDPLYPSYKQREGQMWAYDPNSREWTKLKTKGDKPSGKKLGYFDSARNVFMVGEETETWVFRYKKK